MMSVSATINQNDVLFGRNKVSRSHEGNIQFRSIVASHRDEYQAAHVNEKRKIALRIIREIESMDPPGRFLMNDDGIEGAWVPADEEKTIEKVCHSLREKKKTTGGNPGQSVAGVKDGLIGISAANTANNLDASINGSSPLSDISDNVSVIKSIPLREWINGAVQAVDDSDDAGDNNSPVSYASSSWHYLMPALKIAISLTDQICKAQEESESHGGRFEENDGFMAAGVYDWADRITVYLEPSITAGAEVSNHEAVTSENDEFHAVLKRIDEIINEEDTNYLSATKAILLPPLADNATYRMVQDENQRIYRLGLVFCELFSGGRNRPPNCSPAATNNAADDGLNPNNVAESNINFAREMNISNSTGTNNRSKKGRSQHNDRMPTVGSLALSGLPVSLCDLIGNMIDCINGDLSGDEAFCHMADVRNDLQLMFHKPEIFLRDLDLNELSLTGLQLRNKVYGQEECLSSLKDCYFRSISRNDSFAIITGPSGSGKTALANNFAGFVTSIGGVFLCGKFDQLQKDTPFAAIADVFNEYCSMLVSDGESDHAIAVSSSLRETLGRDARYLIQIIPNIAMILGHSDEVGQGDDCVDAQQRTQYLLCRFVEIISSSSEAPIVCFFDDLQWADTASVNIIGRLLLSSGCSNLFLFGACRDDETSQRQHFWSMISNVSNFGVNAMITRVGLMNKDTANCMISELLCLSPRITRPLTEIVHHKTNGNPLFLSRLMISLSREGLLRLSLSRQRWVWDEEKIQSRKLPNEVAEFLTRSIGQLPADIQAALRTLACFGASSDTLVVKALEITLGIELHSSLDKAAKEGYLDKLNGKYSFCHDRIQEACYNLMCDEERRLLHSHYGLAVFSYTVSSENDSLLFVAVDQVNLGGVSVISDAEQGLLMARLNLKAGCKAISMSHFASGLSYCENGINFFWPNHWVDHYDVSLELFQKASHCAYAVGDHEKLTAFSEQALCFARSFEEKAPVIFLTVSALCDASKLDSGIRKGFWALSMLGVNLYESTSRRTALSCIDETREMLRGLSDDDLLSYKLMDDASKIMAMKFLSRLAASTFMSLPASLPAIVTKMVQLSLVHGMISFSAIGFVYFGSILAGSVDDIKEGYRYVKLGRKIVERFGSKEVTGEVIAISTQLACYVEPMQTMAQFHIQGHTASIETGDTRNATVNLMFHSMYLFYSGVKLDEVKNEFQHALRFTEQHGNISLALITYPLIQAICKLICSEDDPAISLNSAFSDENQLEQYLLQKNPFAAITFYFQKMCFPFLFREYSLTKTYAEKYFEHNLPLWIILSYNSYRYFIIGLASYWIYRQSREQVWADRGNQCLEMIKQWTVSSEWNFLHKQHLLQAEKSYCNSQFENAKKSYNAAISLAKSHKFINDEALAYELAGHFFLEIGEKSASMGYFTNACEKYLEWGAIAKSSSLNDFVQLIT